MVYGLGVIIDLNRGSVAQGIDIT
ncbi:hypothetical protein Rin_00017160, partial [Candidatus Regiella insecticola 5.15]